LENRKKSILSYDFSKNKEIREQWLKQKEKKHNIYVAISEYIEFLENSIKDKNDSYQIYLIEKEIKKLKKEREKYYVPSILAMAKVKPNSTKHENKPKSLIKKIIFKQK